MRLTADVTTGSGVAGRGFGVTRFIGDWCVVVGAKGRASGVGTPDGSEDCASEITGCRATATKQLARRAFLFRDIAATCFDIG
jgi:hypothetical protein